MLFYLLTEIQEIQIPPKMHTGRKGTNKTSIEELYLSLEKVKKTSWPLDILCYVRDILSAQTGIPQFLESEIPVLFQNEVKHSPVHYVHWAIISCALAS